MRFLAAIAISLVCSNVFADTLPVKPELKGSIVVTIHGFNNDKANAMIALHHSKKTFLKKVEPFRKAMLPVSGDTITQVFDDIPFGEYAIAVFQDDNKNMDLDMNALFIPKEKFGFSNNPKVKYGPPSYNDAKFSFETEKKKFQLRFNNFFDSNAIVTLDNNTRDIPDQA